MKIAIIDIGIDKDIANKSLCNVVHYSVYNNIFDECYKTPTEQHGSDCFKEILKQNTEFDILDINATDNNNVLQISNVILGIKKAIELRADIINISLGFSKYSEQLIEVCKEAVDNNIAIISASSHKGEISYPASLKNVIEIQINNKQKETIQKINEHTLSLKTAEKIIEEQGIEFDFSSTSMASAYFSGLFAKKLDSNPLLDKFVMLNKFYDLNIKTESDYLDSLEYEEIKIYEKIKNKKVAVVLLPLSDNWPLNKKLKNKNIVAIYDAYRENFYSCEDKNLQADNFDIVLIINSAWYEVTLSETIKEKFKNYETIFIGKFKNLSSKKSLVYSHNDFISENMSTIENPLILISGVSWSLDKFNTQKQLVENFQEDDFDVKAVTYKPEGIVYGFDVFEYPQKIVFPDIVCSINNYMYCNENSKSFDVWIINVGGGMFINNFNKFDFGKLTEAYFHAVDVDVLILHIPTFIDVDQLNLHVSKANLFGIRNVFFVVSQYTFEGSTLNFTDSVQMYHVDDKVYIENINNLKEKSNLKIFTPQDVKKALLYKEIMNTLEN
jgi:hypothetical protein